MGTAPNKGRTTRGDGNVRRSDAGAALVEFAFVLPLLVAFVLAIFTGGITLDHKMELSKASREAARYGATLPEAQCNPTSNCGGKNWAQVVQSIAVERGNGDLGTADVCAALVSGPGNAPVATDTTHTTAGGTSPCYVDNSSDTGKRVQVSVKRDDTIEAFFFTQTIHLNESSTAKFES